MSPRLLLLAALALPAVTGRPAELGDDIAVALPPFLVEEQTKGPPWRYAEVMGFEVLSRCRDATTRRVVEAHHRLHALLGELLPPELRLQFTVRPTFILYDEELQPASSQEVIRKMLQTAPAGMDEDFGALPGARGFRPPSTTRRISFLPNLRLWDRDAMAVFMIVRRDSFETDRLSLTHDYVRYLLTGRIPSLPAWFIAGLLTLYQKTNYDGDRLTLEPIVWPAYVPPDPAKLEPGVEPPVGALPQLFQPPPAAPHPKVAFDLARVLGDQAAKAWLAHAALFVRWGLDADSRAHRGAFWRFVARSAVATNSEALFVECFGFDYAAARTRLNAYLPAAIRKDAVFRLDRSAARLAPFTLSDATDAQIARIKGDWERMEVPYVRKLSPELAPKYLDLSRRTLRRAYDRDYREPGLLAVMGLAEVDAGNDAGARDFLESAAALGSLRPRANYELARLRFAAVRAPDAPAAARLTAEQAASVLHPLFAARAGEPPLPEVYELIAEVWSASAHPPTRAHLAVLDEGVRLFPRRSVLTLRTAGLYLDHGFRDEAGILLELAARTNDDASSLARIAELRARLGAP
jgi:hypothetical protein